MTSKFDDGHPLSDGIRTHSLLVHKRKLKHVF